MITLKKSGERIRTFLRGQETWRSFHENATDPAHGGFRTLECLREEALAPGVGFEFQAPRDLEIVTYVRAGLLILDDPDGRTVALESGECHRMAARTGTVLQGVNGSLSETARVFQWAITPNRNLVQSPPEKKRFPMAERRGLLRLLLSPHGRDSSLRVRQAVGVYSSILEPGHHLIHELTAGRGAWLHVVEGRIQLVDQMLETGDGASIVEEPAVSMTARAPSEILLFDLD